MRLGIEDLDLILKEKRLRWYGHVERSNGAVKTAFDIQVDGKCGPGRRKMTWMRIFSMQNGQPRKHLNSESKFGVKKSKFRVEKIEFQVVKSEF